MKKEIQNEVTQEEFAQWVIVELMGHVTYAGFAENKTVFGRQMIQLTVPAVEGERSIPAFTKFVSPDALYSVTPVDEEFARRMAKRLRKAPVESYEHNQVIKEMAKDYVKGMKAEQVAQILLNQNSELPEPELEGLEGFSEQ